MVLQCADHQSEEAAVRLLREHVQRMVVKSKTVQRELVELNAEVRLKDENTDFLNTLSQMAGVSSAVLVSYNGDYMG